MKKLSFYLILASLIVILFGSCSVKPNESIRIGVLYGSSAISFIRLIDNPPIIDGKKVEIIIKNEPQQIQALMMSGELDFAILPTIMAANLYNKGVNFKMLACPVWGTLYILTNDTIKTLNELKGRTINVMSQGATPDILLKRMLDEKNIVNARLDYTFTTHADVSQALLMHKISIAVVSEPMVSNLISNDSSIHIVVKLSCEDKMNKSDKDLFVQTAFLVSNRFSTNNKELVKRVSDAYAASCSFCNQQPERTAKLMLKRKLSTKISVAQRSIPLCNIHYVEADTIEDKINRFLEIFYKFDPKSIGGKLPDKQFIYHF
jgi:NitT/TauT family transport system substrate-binding protein